MTDPVDALVADLLSRSEKEWELLIIADWPIYSVSGWPMERHAPFAPALPPEEWCRGVRDQREAVFKELRKAGRGAAIDAAEERAKPASSQAAVGAAKYWTDMLGMPMHVQAAKSVLWIVALYPDLTNRSSEPYGRPTRPLRPSSSASSASTFRRGQTQSQPPPRQRGCLAGSSAAGRSPTAPSIRELCSRGGRRSGCAEQSAGWSIGMVSSELDEGQRLLRHSGTTWVHGVGGGATGGFTPCPPESKCDPALF